MTLWVAILAAAHAGLPEAEDCLQVKVREAYDAGWRFRMSHSDTLRSGGVYATRALMLAGRTYRVLACADAAAADLDVLVYDSQGTVVARDRTTDREPTLDFTPPVTGAYVVLMYHRLPAGTESAAAALALGSR